MVVARYPFGVFVDIDAGFPALILVVRFRNADSRRYTSMDDYPPVGSVVDGRICVYADGMRQIGMTQLDREAMLGESDA